MAGEFSGLWLGQIEINKVNEVGSKIDTSTPTDTPNHFDMRIVLHVDAQNVVRLLRDVTIMQKPYSVENADGTVTDMVRRVLITDDSLLPDYEGIVRRDGKLTGVRLGSLAFDFETSKNDLPLNGNFGAGQTVTGKITLDADHPTNPFKHLYHPDHQTGKTVVRNFSLIFDTEQDPTNPNSGKVILKGRFEERITGVHKIELKVSGTYTLNRVSLIDRLNDQG